MHEQPAIGSEPETPLTVDEEVLSPRPWRDAEPAGVEDGPRTVGAAALADMPGGTLVGTLIHGVFEHIDFDAPDLAAEVERGAAPRRQPGATSTSGTAPR